MGLAQTTCTSTERERTVKVPRACRPCGRKWPLQGRLAPHGRHGRGTLAVRLPRAPVRKSLPDFVAAAVSPWDNALCIQFDRLLKGPPCCTAC